MGIVKIRHLTDLSLRYKLMSSVLLEGDEEIFQVTINQYQGVRFMKKQLFVKMLLLCILASCLFVLSLPMSP